MKTNVALIGFMGTGKTTVGQLLAKNLNKRFIEIDKLIEKKAEKTIRKIFQQDGEIAFREAEIAAVKNVSLERNQIIACGGGVVLNTINIYRLKEQSRIIYLTASPFEILKRTSGNSLRPLLNTTEGLSQIKELLKIRKPFYERAFDISINTTRLRVDEVVEEIIRKLKEDADFHF